MDRLFATARNIRFLWFEIDGEMTLVPEIEAVLTSSGKTQQWIGGDLVNTEKTSTCRFTMSLESARLFVKSMEAWIEDAEKQLVDVLELDGVKSP